MARGRAMKLFAFGDSITAYAGASSPQNAYISKLAAALGATVDNSGVSTAMAIDQGGALINKAPAVGDVSTVWFGTNDQAKYDSDSVKRSHFIDCIRAYAVRLATNPVAAMPVNGVTFTGAWGTGYAYGVHGSTAAGSAASFNVSGESVTLGFLRQYGNSGTFRVRIDGVDKGVFAIGGDVRTLLGSAFGPMALTFSGLGAGSHSVNVEVVTADASNVVFFHWFSGMVPKCKVAVANIPHAVAYTYGGSDANVDAYNSDISDLVFELSSLGLGVLLVDVCSVLNKSDFADNVHPNDQGHEKVYKAFSFALTESQHPDEVQYTQTSVYEGSDGYAYILLSGKMKKLAI